MKISFFITSLGGVGAERLVSNLANHLVLRGHEVSICVLRGDERAYRLENGVKVDYLQPDYYSKKSKFYRIKEIGRVIKYLRRLNHEWITVSFLELPVALSLIFRKTIKGKLIICERNNPLFYSRAYQKVFEKFAHRADGVVCQTSEIASWYKPHIGQEAELIVIPNSISREIISSPFSERNSNNIVTMGRLTAQKNQKLLIEAFAEVAGRNNKCHLIIFGNGPLENDLKTLATSLGVGEIVKFAGFTSNVISALQNADIFVMTSDHEGMPNALAEAMAMGLACISTDCGGGGARELIDNEVNGILIPKGDKNALEKAMMQMIENQSFSSKMAGEAIKIRERLAPNAIHEKWETFLATIK